MKGLEAFLDCETRLRTLAGDAPDDEERARRRRAGAALLVGGNWTAAEARTRLRTDVSTRRRFAHAWRDACSADGIDLAGARRLTGWRAARLTLGAVGMALGVSAAQAACSPRAGEPINLWLFLGVLVLVPLALLLLLSVVAAWTRARHGAVHGLLMRAAEWLQRRAGGGPVDPGARARRVERWLAFGASQWFAAAFALGTLIGFGALLLFRELAFGWSATPEAMRPDHLQAVVDTLALPWSSVQPGWAPDDALVAASRWSPLDGVFVDTGGRAPGTLADAWWPFLLACLAFWGLLPRLLLLGLARLRATRALREQTWNHPALLDLYEDMLPTGHGWSSSVQPAAPRPDEHARRPAPPATTDGAAAVVVWGGWHPEAETWEGQVLGARGLQHAARLHAGGRSWEADAQVLALLAEQEPEELWLLVEAAEAPDKRLLGFLGDLRRQVPAAVLRVALCDWRGDDRWEAVRGQDQRIWRRTLDALRDERLWIGVLGPEEEDTDER